MIGRFFSYLRAKGVSPAVALAYLGAVVGFLVVLSFFFIPGKGFSYFIAFGDDQEDVRLSKVRRMDYYIQRASSGYDAQYYVQIAMDPSLQNTQLKQAVDTLPYRARRILFSATAFVFGGGHPPMILQVYALQNAVCWLLLAVLLLHWFPPRDWECFLRWLGVLFSLGLCVSLRNALIDGPSLLLIALGVYLAEKGRLWWSTAVLAISGLGKETNLLAAAALLPAARQDRPAWMRAVLRGLLVALPLILWLLYLSFRLGPVMDPGLRKFGLPFAAYFHRWQQILGELPETGLSTSGSLWALCILISLTVQFAFLVLRPQWEQAWWRVGMSFALLMVFIGDAVWEGYPGAASRVLLPMQLAFNVLVPTGRWWRVVLLAGNLTILGAPFTLQPPAIDGYVMGGNPSLFSTSDGRAMSLQYTAGWHSLDGNRADFSCWSRGDAGYVIRNPHDFAVNARLRFGLVSAGPRNIRLKLNGTDIWQITMGNNQAITASLGSLRLQPGENRIEWQTDAPAIFIAADPRKLAFMVQNLHFDVLRKWTDPPAR